MRAATTRATWSVLALALVASGCSPRLLDTAQNVSSSCSGFASGGACQEQVSAVAARHQGATLVDLECAAVCDRSGGAGRATVTMGDGSVRRDTFGYVGDPAPMPVPACVGLAVDLCQRVATTQFSEEPPSRRVVSMHFRCAVAPCTDAKAETEYVVTYADGTTNQGSIGWEGAAP
jgi:hypothetical protein